MKKTLILSFFIILSSCTSMRFSSRNKLIIIEKASEFAIGKSYTVYRIDTSGDFITYHLK